MALLCSGVVGEPTLPRQHTQCQGGAAEAEKQLALAVLCSVQLTPAEVLLLAIEAAATVIIRNMLPYDRFAAQAVFAHTSSRPGREVGENQSNEGGPVSWRGMCRALQRPTSRPGLCR